MATGVTVTHLEQAVEGAAARLYVWALKDIPQDLRDALHAATQVETHPVGRRILETIDANVAIADQRDSLVCQDTGLAVFYVRLGERFPLHPARIRGDHGNVLRIQVPEIINHHRHREQVIHRNVEESLNLCGMQIQAQNTIGARGFKQRRYQPGRDRHPGFILTVLPGVSIIG